ncbi:MAG: hypothetical protein KDD69_03405, partial [Bdellovibrionales bacterium]|nr:hypothetical protein [Bdellovibrionales bacterium]
PQLLRPNSFGGGSMTTPFVRRRVASADHSPARALFDARRTEAWASRMSLRIAINPDDTACLFGETGCNPNGVAQSDDNN